MIFEIYKRGQGLYTRLWSALAVGAVVLLGCWRLYETLGGLNITNKNTLLLIQTLVPSALAAVFCFLVFWLVNKAMVADFLIAAEGEIKKVSWSSKQEIYVSTVIVICVVIFMACLMASTDIFFQFLFRQIGLFG